MEKKLPPSIVLIHVKLPVAVNERKLLNDPHVGAMFAEMDGFSRDFEKLFFGDEPSGYFAKVAEGAYLADEDAWYPNIIAMMKWCDEKKFPYAIVPVGNYATTFSGDNQAVVSWLQAKEKRARLSSRTRVQSDGDTFSVKSSLV